MSTDKGGKKQVVKEQRKEGFKNKAAMFQNQIDQNKGPDKLKVSEEKARAAQEKMKKMMSKAEQQHKKKTCRH